MIVAIGHLITDAFGLMCFALLFLLPWRLAAAVVLMAADKKGREQHMLKSNAKSMCNAVGYAPHAFLHCVYVTICHTPSSTVFM